MKKFLSAILVSILIAGTITSVVHADNPIVQTIYTADVAPIVYDGVVYIYAGHDEDDLNDEWFTINEWRCYSSTDMVNWTDCGSPLDYTTFEWSMGDAWAAQCVERNGKFYFYAPVMRNDGQRVIGVAVSDNPTGPFRDAIGKPLLEFGIDPTVLVDDDGRAYIYWGGSNELYYVELNDDMISLKSDIVKVDTNQGLNGPGGGEDDFYEAPWLHKRNDTYYLVYSGNIPEAIYYATSDSPMGPWKHQGKIMNDQGWVPFTSHIGIVDYKGDSYIFYHNAGLPGGFGYHRSVSVEKFKFNEDGSIPFIPYTKDGPAQIEDLNPYNRTEAETIAWEEGIETESCSAGGMNVYAIDDGDYIKVKGVDFGDGAAIFKAGVACGFKNGTIELHLDKADGTKVGTLPVSYTGGEDIWQEKMTTVTGAEGKHDLYLVFKGDETGDLFRLDYWQFGRKNNSKTLVGINATVSKSKIDKIEGKNTANFQVTAIYEDGTTADVTSHASFKAEQNGIVNISNGVVTGTAYGPANINVEYNGKTDRVSVLVKDMETEVTARQITVDKSKISMMNGLSEPYHVTAEFVDGHTENVTYKTNVSCDSNILEVKNGSITAKGTGTAVINLSYQDEKGNTVTAKITVTVENTNPYIQNEAEAYHDYGNVQPEDCGEGGQSVAYIQNGSWIKFNSVDFGNAGASKFEARVASATNGGNIEIHLDSLEGTLIGTLNVTGTGNWQNWVTESCNVYGAKGVHDLYFKFTGGSGNLFNVNWWMFRNESISMPTGEPTKAPEVTSEPTIQPDVTAEPTVTPIPSGVPTSAPTNAPKNIQTTTTMLDTNITPVPSLKKLKILTVKSRKGTREIKGRVSVSKAQVKIKVGNKAYRKATVKGKKFILKLSKLKKNTKIKIKVTKKGYKKLVKVYKVTE